MDSGRQSPAPQPDARIAELISEYFDRRRSGEPLTPESFADEHSDLREQLLPYLDGLVLLDRVRSAADETVIIRDSEGAPRALPQIAGFDVLEEIGRGGMGVVYRACQLATKRMVALKVMLGGQFASPSALRRFDREVQLAAQFQHPGIVQILESGEVGGQKYYAMEYVEGLRLDRYLATVRPDLRSTVALFAEIATAVDCAHRRQVIHRDLKPANVLVDAQGRPHVLDFGLAKDIDQTSAELTLTTCVSSPGQVMGTLPFLSPEQALGQIAQLDARTDVYALGVMLFQAVTGSLPFDGSGRPSELVARILEVPPFRPSVLSSRVDRELETIILKTLEKNPDVRYRSAGELGDDLRRYLAGEPILARRPSGLYLVRKKLRKHRWRVAVVAGLLLVVAIGLGNEVRTARRDLLVARRQALRIQHRLEGGGVSDALGAAQSLVDRHPGLVDARLVLAQAWSRAPELRSHLLSALDREWRTGPAPYAFGELLAELYEAGGEADRAAPLRRAAGQAAPDTAEAWYFRSLATLNLDRARFCAEAAVACDPAHVLAWDRLAHVRLQTGRLDGAAEAADHLVALGDGAVGWTLFKAHLLARQRQFPQAVEVYAAIIAGPATEDARQMAYLCRANVYRRLHEYGRAVDDYTIAIQMRRDDPGVLWIYFQRATALWMLGRPDEAIADYREFRSIQGRSFYADARLYLILRQQGRHAEAETVIRDARRDATDPWLVKILACLAGDLAPADLVNSAGENEAEHRCEAYYYAGEAVLLAGRVAEARSWFEQCVGTGLDFDPNSFPLTPMNEYELAEWRLETLPPAAPSSE